jgi:hypothetical protein
MSNNSDLITDAFIYHGPGACPKCLTPLVAVDTEHNVIDLDSEGNPTEVYSYEECRAACPNCNERYKMMPFNGKYLPYSENAFNLRKAELQAEIDRRNTNRYSNKNNPFV